MRQVRAAIVSRAAGSRIVLAALVAATCASVAGLAWFGFHAVQEWRASSVQLIARVTDERADLLTTALRRDMRGAQVEMLANRDTVDYGTRTIPEFIDQVATAFARYPYPESFFGWRRDDTAGLTFFNRADREPPWGQKPSTTARYPVVVERDAPLAARLVARITDLSGGGRTYVIFDEGIAGVRYQVIARVQYSDPERQQPQSATGFTVNLAWVRDHYFPDFARQVMRIGEPTAMVDYAILDDAGMPVVGQKALAAAAERQFTLQFYDPRIAGGLAPSDAKPWRVDVSAADDASVIWATREGYWTMLVIAAMTLALAISVVMVAYAARAYAAVAEMRVDFVATVTHELKTPLSTIRAIADTLMSVTVDREGVRRYASLLRQESHRLTRLLDNLLAYSRVSDVTEAYCFEEVDPSTLVEECVDTFRRQLTDKRFTLDVTPDAGLPPVLGDRTALQFALDNLIDNAIRYSGDSRWVQVTARRAASDVVFEVCDAGVGIEPGEIRAVHRRFARGRHSAGTNGTGLGLAIVNRIAADHRGAFELESRGGRTTARLRIPVYQP
jgi:signal transduction histidine kinase